MFGFSSSLDVGDDALESLLSSDVEARVALNWSWKFDFTLSHKSDSKMGV